MFEIHSVDFREGLTKTQAESFLKRHNLKPVKEVHLTKHGNKIISRRYRIQDPALFKEFITNTNGRNKSNTGQTRNSRIWIIGCW